MDILFFIVISFAFIAFISAKSFGSGMSGYCAYRMSPRAEEFLRRMNELAEGNSLLVQESMKASCDETKTINVEKMITYITENKDKPVEQWRFE